MADVSSSEEEGEGKKKDEVDDLMAKYDNEEKHQAYLKSDEYKNKIKAKENAKV